MARSFKLKCRLFLSSFRICRPKHQHSLTFPKLLSPEQFPANPTSSCHICYPSPPSPPPSTPVGFFADPSTEKSASVFCSCKLKSYAREKGLLEDTENRGETEDRVSGENKRRCSLFYWINRKKWKEMRVKRKALIVNKWSKGEMGESFVQVKRSKEPEEDFKRSMVQMILEKEIFESKGLEELLQCYLRLNSPEYHRVIVGAFTQVFEFLFHHSHTN